MILLIDNYDSFSYNLYQMIGAYNPNIKVIKNDELSALEIMNLHPSHIIISPGPGYPSDAGVIEDVIRIDKTIPLLGICLGHQAICEVFGSKIIHAKKIMHGKKDLIEINDSVFDGIGNEMEAARYHSLIAENVSEDLTIIATNKEKEIMGVKHNKYPIYGLQFHPESIMTPKGKTIIKNFLEKR